MRGPERGRGSPSPTLRGSARRLCRTKAGLCRAGSALRLGLGQRRARVPLIDASGRLVARKMRNVRRYSHIANLSYG